MDDSRRRNWAAAFEPEAADTQEHLRHLINFYKELEASFLWDTKCSWLLPFPTRYTFGRTDAETYPYVGRRKAKELYDMLLSLTPGAHLQVLGAKGTGKSTVLQSMAGFLQGSGKRRVVYLNVSRFLADPKMVLLEALLMATRDGEDEAHRKRLLGSEDEDELLLCCRLLPRGSLLFIVDDWDRFELCEDSMLGDAIVSASTRHMLVKLSSVNSRTREIWSLSDKRDMIQHTIFFDGPFDSDELQTWIGQSKLTQKDLQHLDRLTGGIPRLLHFYEKAKGDEVTFKKESDMYVEILRDFVFELKNEQELRAAVELISRGKTSSFLRGMKMTCFYRDDETWLFHMLSPYLRSLAERFLMEQNTHLNARLVLLDMQSWIAAVRIDLRNLRNENPARVGWLIEGIIIAMMRYRRKLFEFEFQSCVTYEHGQELVALEVVPEESLRQGVLFIPAAFNEKAVNVVYAKLIGDELVIKGVQISIASWKEKAKKDSHEVWVTEVLPKWNNGRVRISSEFYYVMPEGVKLADINKNTKLRSFQAIDQSLAEFDKLFLDKKPAGAVKKELTTCSGIKRDGSTCQNKSYVEGAGKYWCSQHKQQNL